MNTQSTHFGALVIRLGILLLFAPLFAIDKEGRQLFVDLVEWEFSCDELNRARGRIEALELQLGELLKKDEDWKKNLDNAWAESSQIGMW